MDVGASKIGTTVALATRQHREKILKEAADGNEGM